MIIFNEYTYAEKLLNSGFQQPYHKRFKDVFILCKYYKETGLTKKVNKNNLYEFMKKYDEEFEMDRGDDTEKIAKIINTVYERDNKNQLIHKLRYNIVVGITKYEIDKILELKNRSERNLLFILLVLNKFYGGKRLEVQMNDLFKLSKLCFDGNNCYKPLYNLEGEGYIEQYGGKYTVLIKNIGENIIDIDMNRDLLEQFYNQLKQIYGVVYCNTCGIRIEVTNNKRKYCKDCADEIKLENDRRIQKERYNVLKTSQIEKPYNA